MNLEDAIAVMRPRTPWEAVDFGWLLARRLAKDLWAAWWMVAAPLALALLATTWERPWVGIAMLWLLRPALDGPLLFVLSRGMFGRPSGPREVWSHWRAALGPQLLARVTVWRLDPQRSYRLPIVALEGLRGRYRRKRATILGRRQSSEAAEFTFVCLGLEGVVLMGLLGFVFLMLPETAQPDWETFFNDGMWNEPLWGRVIFLAALTAMTVVQPLYVAGGFGLYLNRRTLLEGWDVQLAFRRLASRAAAAALALALLLPGFAQAEDPGADEYEIPAEWFEATEELEPLVLVPPEEAFGAVQGSPDAEITTILADPEFGWTETETRWRRREYEEAEEVDLGFLGSMLGLIGEVALWLVAIVAAVFLIVRLLRLGQVLSLPERDPGPQLPTELLGFDLRPESLPDDVPTAARALLAAGDRIGALSLLYRAALTRLVRGFALEFEAGATEGDCVRAVRSVGGPVGWFEDVTRAWQSEAYAHRALDGAAISALIDGWAAAMTLTPEEGP